MVIWNILWSFGIFYGHLEYFMVIWNILWSFGIFYCHLEMLRGIFSLVLVYCVKKNLATLISALIRAADRKRLGSEKMQKSEAWLATRVTRLGEFFD
jgi:hypothetical protein